MLYKLSHQQNKMTEQPTSNEITEEITEEMREAVKLERQIYYKNNKDRINSKAKQYYHENKDKIKQRQSEKDLKSYNRIYYERNKERIKNTRKDYKPTTKKVAIECDCGCVLRSKYELNRHLQTNKHKKLMAKQNKPQVKVIKINKNAHRTIKCECGTMVCKTNNGLRTHQKTKKHHSLMEVIYQNEMKMKFKTIINELEMVLEKRKFNINILRQKHFKW